MNNRGQTLIEMIVVTGIVIFLATGVVSATTSALSRVRSVRERTLALSLAQEGVELTRGLRDTGWQAFAAMGAVSSTYCVGSDGVFVLTASTCDINTGIYTRQVTLFYTGGQMNVTSQVSWGGAKTPVVLNTVLTKWQ